MSKPEAITKFADSIEFSGNKLRLTLAERIYVLEALKHKWLAKVKE